MSLPTLTPTNAKIPTVLAHVADCWPDDLPTLTKYLTEREYGQFVYAHQDVADALTTYVRANNLGTGISEASVRRYRKAQR